jgi:hypothetical protein
LSNITKRWELDTTVVRVPFFLVKRYKSIYVLAVDWNSSSNKRPSFGNIDPYYIAAAGQLIMRMLNLNFN